MKKMKKIDRIWIAVKDSRKYPSQCPECGYGNLRVKRGRRVDFYGTPYFWSCSCGWKMEILGDEDNYIV